MHLTPFDGNLTFLQAGTRRGVAPSVAPNHQMGNWWCRNRRPLRLRNDAPELDVHPEQYPSPAEHTPEMEQARARVEAQLEAMSLDDNIVHRFHLDLKTMTMTILRAPEDAPKVDHLCRKMFESTYTVKFLNHFLMDQ